MRLVELADLVVELPSTSPVVVLRELDPPHRQLAFPIGLNEAVAIAYARRGLATPRPLTHELFADVLEQLDVTLETVEVTARQGSTYLAQMTLAGAQGRRVVPCRPSDALALSLRQRLPVPLLVNEALLSGGEASGGPGAQPG
jgi:bifunctional DNase/RNase